MIMPAELFDQAVRSYEIGNPQQAEALCRQAIQGDPEHHAAYHLLGILALQAGRHDVAIALIRRAIALDPTNAHCHFNLGVILVKLGQTSEAIACYREALRVNPYHEEAYNNLGAALKEIGQVAESIACFRQAVSACPRSAAAHYNLGNLLKEQGQRADAIQCYRQAVARDPSHVDALNNLGIALIEQGCAAEAVECYRQVLRLKPQHADACNNLGLALAAQGRLDEALEYYRRALALNPGHAGAHINLGNVFHHHGRLTEAAQCYRQALRIDPGHADAHHNLGLILKEQGQLDEAAACYAQAIKIDPQHAAALNNLGLVYVDQGRLAEAIDCYQQALRVKPAFGDAHVNLSVGLTRLGRLPEAADHIEQAIRIDPKHAIAIFQRSWLRLLSGDFSGGWPDYEQRWEPPNKPSPYVRFPRWDGASLADKSLLVYAEQGLGDTIQFARFLTQIQGRGGTVLFECHATLAKLLAGTPGVQQIIPRGAPLPHFDVQVPLLSLPGLLGTTLTTIPAAMPYLRADPGLAAQWKRALEALGGFKIGIAWQGSLVHKGDRYRSVPLSHFEPLARVTGVNLISLQKGQGGEQIKGEFPLLDVGDRLDAKGAFLDTAAIMTSLDLVITIDSAVAHLAGALGVPVWVVIPFAPDWRWLLEREDSPWYPTMRLFRQRKLGDWDEVFARIHEELRVRHAPGIPSFDALQGPHPD